MHVAAHPYGTLEFATGSTRSTLSRLANSGRALRLTTGVYAVGAQLPPEGVARHHLFELVARFWPGGVLCGRTALAGGIPVDGAIYVAQPDLTRTSELRLPGITIYPVVGPGALPRDTQMPHDLYLSGNARSIVENIHVQGRPPRFRAGTEAAEDRIDSIAQTGGAGAINALFGDLHVIAGHFDPAAVEIARSRLRAVLGTVDDDVRSPRLRARLAGTPFDEARLTLLRNLVADLTEIAPAPVPARPPTARWQWLPFYEAYFSNFIEGTEFGVAEARSIAIDGVTPADRPADAHDVAATYRLANDPDDAQHVPRSGEELLEHLRGRHIILMAARPEKRPGEFKEKYNYAGGYQFVDPALVSGTLLAGFDIISTLIDPLSRAVAMMVLITECHPFDDGNGRVARLVANAELTRAGQVRIIIPTIYRNNYLAGLNAVSNGTVGAGRTLTAIMDFAQRWTSRIDWTSYEGALAMLSETNALLDPGYAESQGIRLTHPS